MGPISRRHVLQMIGATGTVLLAGCRSTTAAPTLLAPAGVLPKPWADALPKPWRLKLAPAQQDWTPEDQARADVLVMGDGWLEAHSAGALQPIASELLLSQLDGQAKVLLANLGALQDRVLPLAVSPWVMLLRDDPAKTQQGWPLLLDSSMAGRVVLPASPRLVMSLADHLGGAQALHALRRQALTYDDRQATNWLLKGEAKVVVLPLSRCIALLGRDPRLRAVLPDSGAPLHWNVLLRPKASREPVPHSWVEQGWRDPLRRRLAQLGWRAPISSSQLTADQNALSARVRPLLFPSADTWSRCWSLPPLLPYDQSALKDRWRDSAPEPPPG
ncbi:substrate-binding domain-containing protein [Synechococcus sp. KORDI-52]|uniref:substrate-binding domain-containing protein n=1 Tax=Synechococcus sp. KORDI-52 TaxID=585425 RepID=UPI0020A6D66F|nr:substrate-binding domain-containing protein [Synechococcus sp. KORDI-52]